ncbi:hypothetical protein M0805_003436 [Coniferiporia weirii]|nr:hypothetical protein M0805_003436 [Coniferiporia weirii]
MAESAGVNIRDDLPRVSIDSVQEWRRIKENFNAAALNTFEAKLAQSGLSSQRNLLLPHLKQFVDRTFEIASPNLRINGRNFDEFNENEQDTDQFDESLDRRVWSLSDQRLKWDLEIAAKRRGIPLEVEVLVGDLISNQRAHASNISGLDAEMDMDTGEESHVQEVERSKTVEELSEFTAELQEVLPVQLERVHRARQVDGEIRSLRV